MGISVVLTNAALLMPDGVNRITWAVLDEKGAIAETGTSANFGSGTAEALKAFQKFLSSQVTRLQGISGLV
jgi:hypothetical protein